jgi:hypothetical protein
MLCFFPISWLALFILNILLYSSYWLLFCLQSCSRYLETTDLNLQDAHCVQFLVTSSCGVHSSLYSQKYARQRPSRAQPNTQDFYDQRPSRSFDFYNQRPFRSIDDNIRTYEEPDLETLTSNSVNSEFIRTRSRSRRSIVSEQRRALDPRHLTSPESEEAVPVFNNDSQIIVQMTCDGGTTWTTVKALALRHFTSPKLVDRCCFADERVKWYSGEI